MLDTRLDPRQAMVACLDQWRAEVVGCDDAGLPDQVRDLEVVSRMLHAVMLEAVAELDSRNLAASAGFGSATLDYGTPLSAAEARRWACDAKIIPLVLGGASEPLDVGRAMRAVPLSLRRALVARDRGCVFPGCDRPPGLCQAHHAQHWADGGDTSIDNCVLLCETNHRHVHCTGWEILIHPSYVDFIPPTILDPDRRPLRNPLRC